MTEILHRWISNWFVSIYVGSVVYNFIPVPQTILLLLVALLGSVVAQFGGFGGNNFGGGFGGSYPSQGGYNRPGQSSFGGSSFGRPGQGGFGGSSFGRPSQGGFGGFGGSSFGRPSQGGFGGGFNGGFGGWPVFGRWHCHCRFNGTVNCICQINKYCAP